MMELERSQGRHRKRSNNILRQIRQQMEFYFSDANLSKDRFLKQQLEQSSDGYLPLELFLKFNKIRSMTSDVGSLRKALGKSTILKVDESLTKVYRITKISNPVDVDDRTLYVECLPPGVNHEWVKQIFSECGKVLYVSLPKYKSTGDIKGFAFVEFDSPETAAKACTMMNNPPSNASTLVGMFPRSGKEEKRLERQVERLENLSGIRKRRLSENDAKEGKSKRKRVESADTGELLQDVISKEVTEKGNESNEKIITKFGERSSKNESSSTGPINKESSGEETNSSEPSCEKASIREDDENGVSSSGTHTVNKQEDTASSEQKKGNKRKQERSTSIEDNTNQIDNKPVEETQITSPTDSQSKKKRRLTQDKETEKLTQDDEETKHDKKDMLGDSVAKGLSEHNICKKRRRSSDTAEDCNGDKRKMKMEGNNGNKEELTVDRSENISHDETADADGEKKKKKQKNKKHLKEKNGHSDNAHLELRVISKKEWLSRKAAYLSQQKENMKKLKERLQQLTGNTKQKNSSNSSKLTDKVKSSCIEFKAGTVVKICTTDAVTRKAIKENLSQFGNIVYVDVIDGTTSAHVRCGDAESAQAVSTASLDGYQMTLLSGDDEMEYWRKLEADRANKLNTKCRSKKRGRDKVLAKADQVQEDKATKHIVFD